MVDFVCLVLFAKERGQLSQIVLRPLTFFTPATTVMVDHNMKTYHRDAIKDMDRFRHNFKNPEQQQDCDVQVITQERQKVAENRKKLTSIIKTILWLGRQNVALRGHREANPADLAGDAAPLESNSGNFYALLKFVVECGDETLRSHLLFGKRNTLYCSPQIQNDILRSAGSWIRQQLVADVKASGMCSILADEVADVSHQEQLSLVVRFVDAADCSIREEFVGFVPCLDGISGEALAAAILKELADLNIPGAMIRGQGYDGASNMSGKNRGVAKIIQNQYPLAKYVHCASHALNLCVVEACKVEAIRNMMSLLKELSMYFNTSPKRQAVLTKANFDIPE